MSINYCFDEGVLHIEGYESVDMERSGLIYGNVDAIVNLQQTERLLDYDTFSKMFYFVPLKDFGKIEILLVNDNFEPKKISENTSAAKTTSGRINIIRIKGFVPDILKIATLSDRNCETLIHWYHLNDNRQASE